MRCLALGEGRCAGPGFGAVRPRLRSGEGGLQRVEGGEVVVVVGVGEEDRLDRDAEGGGLRDDGVWSVRGVEEGRAFVAGSQTR